MAHLTLGGKEVLGYSKLADTDTQGPTRGLLNPIIHHAGTPRGSSPGWGPHASGDDEKAKGLLHSLLGKNDSEKTSELIAAQRGLTTWLGRESLGFDKPFQRCGMVGIFLRERGRSLWVDGKRKRCEQYQKPVRKRTQPFKPTTSEHNALWRALARIAPSIRLPPWTLRPNLTLRCPLFQAVVWRTHTYTHGSSTSALLLLRQAR
jgi:hypothetical protein